MKITIAKVGSRSDVQPYVALERGLQSAGRQVQIATDPMLQGFIEVAGLGYAAVAADPRTALQEESTTTLRSDLLRRDHLEILGSQSPQRILPLDQM